MATLCRYTYDALDRISTRSTLASALASRFYRAGRLTTELQGEKQRTFFQAGDQLLAQLLGDGGTRCAMLMAIDHQDSVLHAAAAGQQTDIAYAPYGHREPSLADALPGFTGAQPEPATGHYLLGNGYRAYNPVLMRFNSPDALSPFGEGGLNAYAYCLGDPVNRIDPTGHVGFFISVTALGLLSTYAGTATLIAGAVTQSSNPELSGKLLTAGAVLGGSGLALLGGVAATRRIGARKETLTSPLASSPAPEHRPSFRGGGADDPSLTLFERIEKLQDERAAITRKLQRLDARALKDPAYLAQRLPVVELEPLAAFISMPHDMTFAEMELYRAKDRIPLRIIRGSSDV